MQFLNNKDFEQIAQEFMIETGAYLSTEIASIPKWVVKALDKAYTLGLEHAKQLHMKD
jgi:hypothetical protein